MRQIVEVQGSSGASQGDFMIPKFSAKIFVRFVASDDSGHDSDEDAGDDSTGIATVPKPKSETKTPSHYRVIIMNDDFTPMDFVIHILQKFFSKNLEEATQIMLQVHQKGSGLCGVFTYEIAETKVYHVNQYARLNRHPLKCTMEKA